MRVLLVWSIATDTPIAELVGEIGVGPLVLVTMGFALVLIGAFRLWLEGR